MERALWVGLGGFFGSMLRHAVGVWLQGVSIGVPLATLVVNTLGSFVLGVVVALSATRGDVSPSLYAFVVIGMCGGFTTMSTFSNEMFTLLRSGLWPGLLYIGVMLGACLLAVAVGHVVGRTL